MSDRTMTAWFVWAALLITMTFFALKGAWAHDQHDKDFAWYRAQRLTPETKQRLNVAYGSCCDEADHFKTRFRLVEDGTKYGVETYEYLAKDGTWRKIHPDLIQRKPTPDGTPVLFINKHDGRELCFIIDSEGG